jgi:hypothetical protein
VTGHWKSGTGVGGGEEAGGRTGLGGGGDWGGGG